MKYAIYSGLGGGFGGAKLQTIDDFNSYEEAEELAYQMALEEYEGLHGILNWFECRGDLLDSFPDIEIDDEDVDMRYQEEVESWIDYYILPADLIPPEDLE